MNPVKYLKLVISKLSEISEKTGYPFFYIARYFLYYCLRYRVQIWEFQILQLYDYSPRKMSQFLLWRQCMKNSDLLNAAASEDDKAIFDDKCLFNREFSRFVKRDWLYLPDCTVEQVQDFIEKHPVFLIKACVSTQGKNIFKYSKEEITPDELLSRYGSEPYLIEALIVQHPVLSAVNPSSVNTVRFISAKKGDRIAFVGAALRCGGADQFVDNFHHGGTAYPLDLDSGIINACGRSREIGGLYLRHPVTGTVMPGLQIPHWDQVKQMVTEATLMAHNIGYIGWDIAITEDGAEFVEGNIDYPGNTIIQLTVPVPMGGFWSLSTATNSIIHHKKGDHCHEYCHKYGRRADMRLSCHLRAKAHERRFFGNDPGI